MKKPVTVFMVTLILVGTLVMAFDVRPVRASGIIYIRTDGSVEPHTAPVSTADNVTYTLTGDIDGVIIVERSSIEIDGSGHTLQGTNVYESKGMSLNGMTNVTMRNLIIRDFYYGVWLQASSIVTLSESNITNNEYGVYLDSSPGNMFYSNKMRNNDLGIYLFAGSSSNTASGNNIEDSYYGIRLESSSNTVSGNNITNSEHGILGSSDNTISGNNIMGSNQYGIKLSGSGNTLMDNNMTNNGFNFGVSDLGFGDFLNYVDTSNIVDGKPVHYWVDRRDMAVPLDAGYVALVNCINITVQNLNLTHNGEGVALVSTTNSTIINNNITNNDCGIQLVGSSNNTICGNNITASNLDGVVIYGPSKHNTISGNNIKKGDYSYGIRLKVEALWRECDYNTISGNNITDSYYGFSISGSHNTIIGNRVTNNYAGLGVGGSNNTLIGNVMANNSRNFLGGISVNSVDTSNTVDGKPVYYWVDRRDMAVPLDAGYVALVNCINITVQNLNLTHNGEGVALVSTTNSTIINNNITNNDCGVSLYRATNSTITNNNITHNGCGVSLYFSENNSVSGNKIGNNREGIFSLTSSFNTISGNKVTGNSQVGVGFYQFTNNTRVSGNEITANVEYGIRFYYECFNNTVSGNNITDNGSGVDFYYLCLAARHNNTICGNNISSNNYGISVDQSLGNTIYHNNFVSNNHQVLLYNSEESDNAWDDGYEGNYWSNYDGTDLDSDGVGDTHLPWEGVDYYPLMNPFAGKTRPIARLNAFPTTVVEDSESVEFDAGASYDLDGNVVSYLYDFGDGYNSSWITEPLFYREYADPGEYSARARVKDNDGLLSGWSDSVTITVTEKGKPENKPPIAYIDGIQPNPALQGETVNFQGHGTDEDGSITEFRWVSSIDGFLRSSASFTTNSLSTGVHVIFFEVKDDDGAWSEAASETISIRAVPNWAAIAERARLRREKYAYFDDLLYSGWWHEVAMSQIDPYEVLFNPLKAVAGELASLLLEYFTGFGLMGPITIIKYSYDISARLVNLFQAIYYDEIAATLGGAYARYNIRTEVDVLLDAVDTVISAANAQDIAALDQAFVHEKQATEAVYVGTNEFDNAIMTVLEDNTIWSSTTRRRIYLELRGYLVGLHSTLEGDYAYLTQELGETKDLAEEKPEGAFTPRHNVPIVIGGSWEVGGRSATEAEAGEPVTASVTLRTVNVSRTDYDKVHGTVTVYVKKDLVFWPDEACAQQSFEVTVEAGAIERLSFSFTPDQKSSLGMRGYYLEVEFTGHFLILGTTVENRLVQWTHGGYQMQNAYPPRLRVVEEGTLDLSGTLITLKETQHKLYLQVYDSQGNHVCVDHETGQQEIGIADAQYFDFANGTIAAILPSSLKDFTVVVDGQYAEEAEETYTLTITVMNNEQVISQKEIQSTIPKEAQNRYVCEISDSGEISLVEAPPTPFPWWILGVVAIVMLGVGTTLVLWKRRKP